MITGCVSFRGVLLKALGYQKEFWAGAIGRSVRQQHRLIRTISRMSEYGVVNDWAMRDLSASFFASQVPRLIDECRSAYDRVANVDDSRALDYEHVIKPLAEAQRKYATGRSQLEFPQHSAPEKDTRDASTEAARSLQDFDVEISMRKDVFDRIQHFADNYDLNVLDPEAKRFAERLVTIGKRNGLHLSEELRAQVKEIKKRMSELSITFQRNLNEENTQLEFSEQELDGLPQDFLQSLEKLPSGKLRVTLKYPHFFPIVRKASNEQTRLRLETAYHSRCMKENTPILEELVELRQKHASLLGYATHASYVTELLMAKTAESVKTFLEELGSKLNPLWEREHSIMLDLKENECKQNGWEFDGRLNYWDCRYYMSMVEEKMYAVDQNALKEYFPLQVVTQGLLKIYQEILGLRFTCVEAAAVWHPDVLMYRVENEADGELLGYFFLDLFPRDGKYGHAAVFPLQPGCLAEGGKRQVAVAAMMANFTKPTEMKPSLLDHKEVETYFHEFGHIMHQLCTRAKFAMFSGTRVERDFVEAPSQMLQNWVWEKVPLQLMSGHYVNGTTLPDAIIEKLVQSQRANAGIFNLRQVALALFDQCIHTGAKADTCKLFNKIFEEVTGIPPIPDTNMPASFGHLAGGYDAQYYGYLWSEVFSMDMFYSRFKKEGIMDSKVGLAYRRCILEPGGSLDGAQMLSDFLGREPEMTAFLVSKGLTPPK